MYSSELENLKECVKKKRYAAAADRKKLICEQLDKVRQITLDKLSVQVDSVTNGTIIKRRAKALSALLELLDSDAPFLDPQTLNALTSPEETLVHLESLPQRTDYDGIDYYEDITLAAAMWMLDDLKRTGRLRDAFKYLPRDYSRLYDMDIPVNFFDPCFDNDLIRSVMCVIKDRNKADGDGRHAHDGVYCGEILAEGRQKLIRSSFRRSFDSVFGLVDRDRIRAAKDRFKEKQKEIIRIYAECMASFDREQRSAVDIMARQPSVLMVKKEPPDDETRIRNALSDYTEVEEVKNALRLEFSDYFNMPFKAVRDRLHNGMLARKYKEFVIPDPYETCFALLALLEDDDDAAWLMQSGYCLVNAAASLLPWHVSGNDPHADWTSEFDDDEWTDPALVYDRNEWITYQAENGSEDATDYYVPYPEGRNLAQILFSMCGGVMPRNLHPFERDRRELTDGGMTAETVNKLVGNAEILFLTQFQSKALNLRENSWGSMSGDDTGNDDLTYDAGTMEAAATETNETSGKFNGNEPEPTEPVAFKKTSGYWGNVAKAQNAEMHRIVQDSGAARGEGEDPGSPDDHKRIIREERDDLNAEAELRRIKDENKSLRGALSEIRRESEAEKAKYERELQALRMEHRELADLRELIFNQIDGGGSERVRARADKPGADVTFPFETVKRTVVFGGHESFLKSIKPKFTNVRFVDVDQYAFSPELVRNADVVWIQNNHISHAQYYGIINEARKHGIQVRYFPYSSADKCAEILAKEDAKP